MSESLKTERIVISRDEKYGLINTIRYPKETYEWLYKENDFKSKKNPEFKIVGSCVIQQGFYPNDLLYLDSSCLVDFEVFKFNAPISQEKVLELVQELDEMYLEYRRQLELTIIRNTTKNRVTYVNEEIHIPAETFEWLKTLEDGFKSKYHNFVVVSRNASFLDQKKAAIATNTIFLNPTNPECIIFGAIPLKHEHITIMFVDTLKEMEWEFSSMRNGVTMKSVVEKMNNLGDLLTNRVNVEMKDGDISKITFPKEITTFYNDVYRSNPTVSEFTLKLCSSNNIIPLFSSVSKALWIHENKIDFADFENYQCLPRILILELILKLDREIFIKNAIECMSSRFQAVFRCPANELNNLRIPKELYEWCLESEKVVSVNDLGEFTVIVKNEGMASFDNSVFTIVVHQQHGEYYVSFTNLEPYVVTLIHVLSKLDKMFVEIHTRETPQEPPKDDDDDEIGDDESLFGSDDESEPEQPLEQPQKQPPQEQLFAIACKANLANQTTTLDMSSAVLNALEDMGNIPIDDEVSINVTTDKVRLTVNGTVFKMERCSPLVVPWKLITYCDMRYTMRELVRMASQKSIDVFDDLVY